MKASRPPGNDSSSLLGKLVHYLQQVRTIRCSPPTTLPAPPPNPNTTACRPDFPGCTAARLCSRDWSQRFLRGSKAVAAALNVSPPPLHLSFPDAPPPTSPHRLVVWRRTAAAFEDANARTAAKQQINSQFPGFSVKVSCFSRRKP